MSERAQVVLITGASSGLGRATAQHLSARGRTVYGTSRQEAREPTPFRLLRMDVRDEESVRRAVEAIVEREGRLDAVVNNAGIGICGAVEDTSLEEARLQLETNFFGVVRVIQAALPHMRRQRAGRIVNVGSLGGLVGLPFQAFYSASKFALEGLTEALRLELRPFGIELTNLDPGDFRTEMTAHRIMVARSATGPYTAQLRRTLAVYEHDETHGADPDLVARSIERILAAPAPLRVRYLVGRRSQTALVRLKPFLGAARAERLLARHCRMAPPSTPSGAGEGG